MKKRNDFLLPNELGWECNDKISKEIDTLLYHFQKRLNKDTPEEDVVMYWEVLKAQLMDNVYAIIKEYQK